MKKKKLFSFDFCCLFVYLFDCMFPPILISGSLYVLQRKNSPPKNKEKYQKKFELLSVVVCSSSCFVLSSFSFLKHCLLFLCIWQIPL